MRRDGAAYYSENRYCIQRGFLGEIFPIFTRFISPLRLLRPLGQGHFGLLVVK